MNGASGRDGGGWIGPEDDGDGRDVEVRLQYKSSRVVFVVRLAFASKAMDANPAPVLEVLHSVRPADYGDGEDDEVRKTRKLS